MWGLVRLIVLRMMKIIISLVDGIVVVLIEVRKVVSIMVSCVGSESLKFSVWVMKSVLVYLKRVVLFMFIVVFIGSMKFDMWFDMLVCLCMVVNDIGSVVVEEFVEKVMVIVELIVW